MNKLFIYLSLFSLIFSGLYGELPDLPDGYSHIDFTEEDEDLDLLCKGSDHSEKENSTYNNHILEALPSSIVAGCVNIISGDYVESECDLVVPGPVPFAVRRSWCSSEKKWNFSHKPVLHSGLSKGENHFVAGYMDGSGSGFEFRRPVKKGIGGYTIPKKNFKKGSTNCGLGEISGQTNWKNASIYAVKKNGNKRFLFRSPSGVNRIFGHHKGKGTKKGVKFGEFRIISELHPNGVSFKYSLPSKEKMWISSYNSVNKLLFSVRTFREKTKFNDNYYWKSDAGEIKYGYNSGKLYQVYPTNETVMWYRYDKDDQIGSKVFPDGRELSITYQDKKVSSLGVLVKRKRTYATTHTFEYKSDARRGVDFRNVYDAEGNQTTYAVKDKRLIGIYRYNGKSKIKVAPLTSEHFNWDKYGKLTSRIFDGSKGEHFHKELEYDLSGNITKETLVSNLTGETDKNEDVYVKTYRSSKDGWNLPVEENDGRKISRFAYVPNTNLLKQRFTCTEDRIIKREFFEYDINGTAIKESYDDGESEDQNNLTGVTERHIKIITPTSSFPFGLPEKTEEFSLDLSTGEYLHLKTTICSYSPQGKKIEEQHYDSDRNLAYTLTWKYNRLGQITEQTDALGQTVYFTYDSTGDKIGEETPNLVKTFHYDLQKRLIKEEEVWSDGTLLVTSHRYNSLNKKIATIDTFGNETFFAYDTLGRLIETQHPPVNGVRPIEKTEYDALGNPIAKWDALGHCTKTKYTARGKPYHIEYPDGSVEENRYTLDGLLCKKVEKNGLTTQYTHDLFGRITKTEVYSPSGDLLKSTSSEYSAFHLLSETDEEGLTTHYSYDPFGRLIREKKQDQITEYTYDTLGRKIQTIQWIDAQTAQVLSKDYDLLNRVIEERTEDLNGTVYHRKSYSYDHASNRTKVTSYTKQGPATTHTLFTPQNKPCHTTDPLGNQSYILYDFEGPHLKITQVDPLGNQEIQTLNSRGKEIYKMRLNPLGECIQEQKTEYDLCQHPLRVHHTVYQNTTQADTRTTEWEYDAMGNPIRCTEVGEKTTFYFYNLFGQKERTLTPNGVTLYNTYDLFGRLKTYVSSDHTVDYCYSYDLKDRLLEILDHVHGTKNTRTYDLHGRLASETLDTEITLEYRHDHLDRLTYLKLPDKTAIRYIYNPSNLIAVERIKNDAVVYTHRYTEYDLAANALEEELIADIGKLTRQKDLLSRVTQVQAPHQKETLTYDFVSNLIERTLNGSQSHYTYDDLYQLTKEAGDETHEYKNDSLYNRIEKNSSPYTVNALNQLLSESDATYSYDFNGNLIEKQTANQTTHYLYDALNRLTEVISDTDRTLYTYDSFHRRLTKTHNGVQEKYLYIRDSEIGTESQLRILGKGLGAEIGAAIAFELDDEVYIPLHDSSGNVTTLLNTVGEVVQSYRYTAFGEVQNSSQSIDNPWQFSSKRFDPETGFFYFGRRYYSPDIGRWITPDPAGFEDGPNLYAYVHNSPLIYIDPDGQLAFLIPIALNIAVSCAAEYLLPVAVAGLQQYAGGTFAAAALTGVVNGYNGNYTSSAFSGDLGLGIAEKAGMAIGTLLSVNPSKVTVNTVTSVAKNRVIGGALKKASSEGLELLGKCVAKTGRGSAKQAADKAFKVATQKGIAKGVKDKVVKNTDLDALSKAGQVMDRSGLTRAGRALDKHGNRPGSVFPLARGNALAKNRQGQFHLDDILTDPNGYVMPNRFGGIDFYRADNAGVRFYKNGTMRGFLEPK